MRSDFDVRVCAWAQTPGLVLRPAARVVLWRHVRRKWRRCIAPISTCNEPLVQKRLGGGGGCREREKHTENLRTLRNRRAETEMCSDRFDHFPARGAMARFFLFCRSLQECPCLLSTTRLPHGPAKNTRYYKNNPVSHTTMVAHLLRAGQPRPCNVHN